MSDNKKKEEVLKAHIEELQNLQKDYSEKIEVLQAQHADFAILIDTLSSESARLETVDVEPVQMELNTSS